MTDAKSISIGGDTPVPSLRIFGDILQSDDDGIVVFTQDFMTE